MTSELLKTCVICGGAWAKVTCLALSHSLALCRLGCVGDLKRASCSTVLGSTKDPHPAPFAIVPPAWGGSVSVPATVPNLLGGDFLQLLTLQTLQKRLACLLSSRAPRVFLFTHPSVCIRISFFEEIKAIRTKNQALCECCELSSV